MVLLFSGVGKRPECHSVIQNTKPWSFLCPGVGFRIAKGEPSGAAYCDRSWTYTWAIF